MSWRQSILERCRCHTSLYHMRASWATLAYWQWRKPRETFLDISTPHSTTSVSRTESRQVICSHLVEKGGTTATSYQRKLLTELLFHCLELFFFFFLVPDVNICSCFFPSVYHDTKLNFTKCLLNKTSSSKGSGNFGWTRQTIIQKKNKWQKESLDSNPV